ncbi:MAG: carboxylesterase family protein, partial [Gammaproteobacteria bacterium]
MRRPVAVVAGLLLGLAACGVLDSRGDSPTRADAVVVTDAGRVRGVVAGDHRLFAGVPYAAAPAGERWRPPAPAPRWRGCVIVHRVIATFLIQQAGLQRTEGHSGAVTLIQRFASAAHKIAGSDFEQPEAGPNGVKGRESP